jgi:hypothetical protein
MTGENWRTAYASARQDPWTNLFWTFKLTVHEVTGIEVFSQACLIVNRLLHVGIKVMKGAQHSSVAAQAC